MNRKVIVISEDAMVYEDLEELKTLPNFASVMPHAAQVKRVRSVYPSVTYPAHATMMTGVYPDRHGIINNEQLIMGEKTSLWTHMRSAVKAPTVFDTAKAAGMSTSGCYWPVTGADPAIDHNISEYWPQHGESTKQAFRDAGSSEDIIRDIITPNLPLLTHRKHPYCDQFTNACACALLRTYQPDLLMIHVANIDAYRHRTGLFTPQVRVGLVEADIWLGDLLRAAKDAGVYDQTDFFIVSDHGQMNIVRSIAVNALLRERGFIDVDEQGRVRDYVAFSKTCALSAQIYLKHPEDRQAYDAVLRALNDLREEGVYGIGRVFEREEVRREQHLDGAFSFVIETDGYTTFSNDWQRPLCKPLDGSDYRFGRATHGHLPDKGPQPTLIAFGPHIKPGAVLESALLVDEAPTFAHALGITMPDTDGRVLHELFTDR